MGFEQQGQEPFRFVVSDTQAYRQFGNAVVVPVIESIAKLMQPWLAPPSAIPEKTNTKGRAVA